MIQETNGECRARVVDGTLAEAAEWSSPAPSAYRSSPIRTRRSRAEIERVKTDLYDILAELRPATVRQTFYAAVSRGVIPKTEAVYKNVVGRLLVQMRRAGEIPFGWIADSTRWMRKPKTYASVGDMLHQSQQFFRRALWDNQDAYVEIWLEKDALAGVILDVTSEFDVPLMVTRGYPSITYLYEAAEAIANRDKPAYLYYFGDFDPSGLDITRAVDEGIREFAPDSEIHFERVAVTPEQIRILGLPTRPTKTTDSRSKGFGAASVEVDAIPPATLRALVQSYIETHIDQDQLERTRLIEEQERRTLDGVVNALEAARNAQVTP